MAVYFGLGAMLWVGASVTGVFFVAAMLYNLALILVALLDLVLSPQPAEFEIAREAGDKMNLGAANRVALSVRMTSTRALQKPITVTLRDEPPQDWPVRAPENSSLENSSGALPAVARVEVRVLPLRESAGEYFITPTRRGDFHFGNLAARYPTLLGLWHRQFKKESRQQVRVYPDTTEVRRYELRLRQGRLRDIGLHLLRLRGRGTEFESLREYSRDDEYKAINWKASARHGKLISTNYEIERDQTVLIAIDCGRMMTALAVSRESDEQTTPLSKLDCAINATVLLSHVAASMGDSVGLLLFSDTVLKFIAPRKGKVQTGAIIEALYSAQPTLVEPDYQAAYEFLIGRKVRRALVVTFTDLIDAEASRELLMASGALRKHHNPLCVTINNRDVIEMAGVLPSRAEEMYSKAMAMKMLHGRSQALEELRQRGVGILDVEARELTVNTVNRYLDLKARMAL